MQSKVQPNTTASEAANPMASGAQAVLSGQDAGVRFKISTLLRTAENEMDVLHGMYLEEVKKTSELGRLLQAANEKIAALEAKPKEK